MMLRRLEPVSGLGFLSQEMDRMLESLVGSPSGDCTRRSPATDLIQEGDDLRAELEVPGFSLGDLEISILEKRLVVAGKVSDETEKEETKDKTVYRLKEHSPRSFSRAIVLPFEVDVEKTEAQLKNGVLTVWLPRAESTKPRVIKVLEG